jgi:hypothetical protein
VSRVVSPDAGAPGPSLESPSGSEASSLGAPVGCAAIGASFASVLPLQPSASLAIILTTGSTLALLVFVPVAMGRPKEEVEV